MIVDRGDLRRLIAAWRTRGFTVACTNGCFRLLHIGHLATIAFAAQQADRLIVAVDDDAAVARLKGSPIVPAEQRALVVSVIRRVDAVVLFGHGDLDALMAEIKPDVLVKGEEYRGREIVGAAHAKRLAFTPMVPDVSTTRLVARINGPDL